jgi:hypothetical protein
MSETSLKNSVHNVDYELYSEDYFMNQLWQFGSKSEEEINAEIAGITTRSGITDTISTSGNIMSNFLKPW